MAVFADACSGTIGGGHLELQAIAERAAGCRRTSGEPVLRYALGPSLGQCCGGVVAPALRAAGRRRRASLVQRLSGQRATGRVFGGGHVGKALVQVLGTLPFSCDWIDSRDEIFPGAASRQRAVRALGSRASRRSRSWPARRCVLVMSFSHAEDLDIVAACLKRLRERGDLPMSA
jgi:xanthine dehydrogenase accessory factor